MNHRDYSSVDTHPRQGIRWRTTRGAGLLEPSSPAVRPSYAYALATAGADLVDLPSFPALPPGMPILLTRHHSSSTGNGQQRFCVRIAVALYARRRPAIDPRPLHGLVDRIAKLQPSYRPALVVRPAICATEPDR